MSIDTERAEREIDAAEAGRHEQPMSDTGTLTKQRDEARAALASMEKELDEYRMRLAGALTAAGGGHTRAQQEAIPDGLRWKTCPTIWAVIGLYERKTAAEAALAYVQAQNARMRDALSGGYFQGDNGLVIDRAKATAALSQPADSSALDAALADEREACARLCDQAALEHDAGMALVMPHELARAIRSRKP